MIGLTYTLIDKEGNSFKINDHVTDPRNFIALQAYPQWDLDIKNSEINKEGQHGLWDFFSFYGRRTMSFEGVIVADSEAQVEQLKDQMIRVLSFPSQPTAAMDGQIYLRWTDLENKSWEIECKLSNWIQWNRQLQERFKLEFRFTLKAASPFILSQNITSQVGIRGWQTSGGIFPLSLPALLGESDSNVLTILNTGSFEAQTVIRIYGEVDGPVTNPRIKNKTTGKEFKLSSTLADETEFIEIDSAAGTVVDQDGNDRSGEIIGDSSFIVLVAGTNQLIYLSDEDPLITLYQPSGPFSVQFRTTKI